MREREMKRILHEEELKKLEAESENPSENGRVSERQLKAQMQQRQRELEKLQQEDTWTFDCSKCGVHGQNLVSDRNKRMPFH